MEPFKVHKAHIPFIDSTQKRALALVEELGRGRNNLLKSDFTLEVWGNKDILRLSADCQSQGVGQGGLTWFSPPGNVSVTFVIPWPSYLSRHAVNMPQIVNLALCYTLEAMGFDPQIKWINDLLLIGQKCGGILCHYLLGDGVNLSMGIESYGALVMGIGLNVNISNEECEALYKEGKDPSKIKFTSLAAVQGKHFDEKAILESLTKELVNLIERFIATKSFKSFLPEVHKRLAYLGQEVVYFGKDKETDGEKWIFKGIDPKGFAVLENEAGRKTTLRDGKIRPV